MSKLPHFLNILLTDGGEVVSLAHQVSFIPRKIHGINFFFRNRVHPRAIEWLEVLDDLKNPMSPSEIEPANFNLVAQCN
jgi:hypothetical protein